MENSIEEDIKILEEFIKYYEAEATSRKFRGTLSIRVDEDDIDALENLINMYKRVLKENEQLRTEVNSLKKDISNMYDEEVIISIISDNFNLSRNEVLKLLGGE